VCGEPRLRTGAHRCGAPGEPPPGCGVRAWSDGAALPSKRGAGGGAPLGGVDGAERSAAIHNPGRTPAIAALARGGRVLAVICKPGRTPLTASGRAASLGCVFAVICNPRRTPPPTAASERSGACGEPRLPYGRAPLRRSPRLRRRGVERRCCAPLEAGRRPWRSPRRVDWADAATRPVPAYEGEPRSREADHGSGAKPHCPRPGSSVYQELQLSRGGGYPPLKGHRRQK